jgi:hypothetical protein
MWYNAVQKSGLARIILTIAKQTMELDDNSDFLQTSCRKYQWRESLLLCLARLTEGFVIKETGLILEEMNDQRTQPTGRAWPNAQKLLQLISDRNMIPMNIKPHSIFFLCSEENFVAACMDWLLFSINNTKEMKVGT